MGIRYQVCRGKYTSEGLAYTGYGIKATDGKSVVAQYDDLFLERRKARALVRMLNDAAVPLDRLQGVVEDAVDKAYAVMPIHPVHQ